MAYELKLPDLGEGLTEGEVARWLVAEGDEVVEDQPLLEIATDKTTVEIPSPAGGTVTRIVVPEGEIVPVGTVLVVIDGEAQEAAPVAATPAVRALAKELGVDLGTVVATGPGGRITEADLRAAAAPSEGRRVPLRGVRRQMARHLATSHREVASVTFVEECDFSNIDLALLLPTVLQRKKPKLRQCRSLGMIEDAEDAAFFFKFV